MAVEETVLNYFGMSSKNSFIMQGLCQEKKELFGTVVDIGVYTMFLEVRVVVIDSGKIRADSSDAELLKCCTEAVFPGECEKRRVVCAVLSGTL